MRFGRFDDERREYVITRPDTPLPWINYLGSEDYLGIISNTAGGYAFYQDARLRRITRYRYNNAPLDIGGRYIYVRDDDSGSYWSPSWQPVGRDVEDYECRHGMGYTSIGSRTDGIHTETTYFVPVGQNLEVWRTRLTNERAGAARVSLFSAVEWCLWDANDDATNFQRNYSIGEVEIEDGVIFHKTEYRERRNHFAWFACSEDLAGYDTQRDDFLGPYRGWDRPLVVEGGRARDSVAHGWQPIGSHHVRLELAPGEAREIIFALGYAENPAEAKFDPPGSQTIAKAGVRPSIERYTSAEAVEQAFADLGTYWDALLGQLQVRTPNVHLDRMVNSWNAYQCMVTFNLSRSASMFESGIGRGMGFRDSNQDLLGFVHMVPERARQRILDISATQLPTGGAYHQYQPLTKRGNDAVGSGFNDDPCWLVLGVGAYLRETGDSSILDEQVPFDNEPGSEASLYQHLVRAIEYTLARLGPHGLPLIGRADWNDCLNLNCFSETPGESFQTTENKEGGQAESVFIAALFVLAVKEMRLIAEDRRDDVFTRRCDQAEEDMVAAIDAHGWDGAWFRRAYDFFGDVLGSAQNEEGQIFVEPQGIAIMAGIGTDDGRAEKTLASVRDRLATDHGIVLLDPPFSRYYPEYGEISSYPPGYKENAGIFCHTNPWLMMAEAAVGNGEGALDYYLRLNPSAREDIAEVHRCEPYVYAQMIAGKDAPTHGEAKNSWLSGTAAWNFVAATQGILGIRPEHTGLRVDPALPADWDGYTMTRRYRGTEYRITVEKPVGETGRVTSLEVDGETVAGNVIPPTAEPGGVVEVRARIGGG
jgi:cellobiose phosphorylase